MKKYKQQLTTTKLTIILVCSITIFYTLSCMKNKVSTPSQNNVTAIKDNNIEPSMLTAADYNFISINDNILAFDSIKNFIKVIESWPEENRIALTNILKNNAAYNSLYKNIPIERDDDGIPTNIFNDTVYSGDFIKVLLNVDKIVKIGNHYFKVDEPNQRVLVLNQNFVAELNDLKINNLSNPHILNYDIGDNVLDYLREDETTAFKTTRCNETGIGSFVSPPTTPGTFTLTSSNSSTPAVYGGRMNYRRFGVWFRVEFEWEVRNVNTGERLISNDQDVRLCFTSYKYKIRCGSRLNMVPCDIRPGNSNVKSWHGYSGHAPLNELCLQFHFKRADNTGTNSGHIWIQKNCSF